MNVSTRSTRITIGILAGIIVMMLTACDLAAASNPTPEPTPDLLPTVEAMVNQRLAEKERQVAIQQQMSAILTPEPTPTATQSPTPTLTPTGTPIPMPTQMPTPTPKPTATPVPTPVLTNWIDRYQHQYGTLPVYPEWLEPLFPDHKGKVMSKGHKSNIIPSVGTWCGLLPSKRRMLLEFYQWRGESYMDILDRVVRLAPPSLSGSRRSVIDLLYDCPPEGGLP